MSDAEEAKSVEWRGLIGHEPNLKSLLAADEANRLPPVLLLVGREGIGKRSLAAQIAAKRFCHAGSACGVCSDCLSIVNLRHPEVLWLEHATFQVEHARALQEHLSIQSGGAGQKEGLRTVIVIDADLMTVAAANRLLKLLEEPPKRSRIIMTTSKATLLPATLLSRCSRWQIAPPLIEDSLDWLKSHPDVQASKVSESELLDALQENGLSPGKALLHVCDAEKRRTAEEVFRALTVSRSRSEALSAAEQLAKHSDWTLKDFVSFLEKFVNYEYRLHYGVNGGDHEKLPRQNSMSWTAVMRRRELLREIKPVALRSQTRINMQLLAEAWAQLHLNEPARRV